MNPMDTVANNSESLNGSTRRRKKKKRSSSSSNNDASSVSTNIVSNTTQPPPLLSPSLNHSNGVPPQSAADIILLKQQRSQRRPPSVTAATSASAQPGAYSAGGNQRSGHDDNDDSSSEEEEEEFTRREGYSDELPATSRTSSGSADTREEPPVLFTRRTPSGRQVVLTATLMEENNNNNDMEAPKTTADDDNDDEMFWKRRKWTILAAITGLILGLAAIVVVVVLVVTDSDNNSTPAPTVAPTISAQPTTSAAPTGTSGSATNLVSLDAYDKTTVWAVQWGVYMDDCLALGNTTSGTSASNSLEIKVRCSEGTWLGVVNNKGTSKVICDRGEENHIVHCKFDPGDNPTEYWKDVSNTMLLFCASTTDHGSEVSLTAELPQFTGHECGADPVSGTMRVGQVASGVTIARFCFPEGYAGDTSTLELRKGGESCWGGNGMFHVDSFRGVMACSTLGECTSSTTRCTAQTNVTTMSHDLLSPICHFSKSLSTFEWNEDAFWSLIHERFFMPDFAVQVHRALTA